MHSHQLAAGLFVCFLAVCHPKVSGAQYRHFFNPQQNGFARQAPRSGSFSRVNNDAYQREVDLGPVDLTRGVSNTHAVTKSNGGFRNGGTTSIADRNAVSRGINLGGLDIGSTLTRTQTRTNGEVSRGIEHDVNIGNLGIGTSLSRDNLQRGFGLQRDGAGRLSLGLGLLNIGLSQNAQKEKAVLSQAQVNAQGQNAQTRANSQSQTQQQNYGNVGVRETRTRSNAVGRSQFGQTQTNFFGGDNFPRGRRSAGSTVTNNNQLETSSNVANTNAGAFQDGDRQGTQSNASSQSLFQGVNGQTAGALTGSQTSSVEGPNGYVSNTASSNVSANSNNGGNASASASSQAGNGGNNALTKGFTNGGGFAGFRRREQKQQYRIETRYPRPTFLTHTRIQDDSHPDEQQQPEATELLDLNRPMYNNTSARQTLDVGFQYDPLYSIQQPRTVNTILDFITNLFSGCVSPCTLTAYYNNRCCNITIPARPPAVCCQGQQYPLPYTPLLGPQPIFGNQQYPINCCSTCNSYSYYGPPPCIRYGNGGSYGGFGGGFGGGSVGGAGLSFGATSPFGNAGVSLNIPPYYG